MSLPKKLSRRLRYNQNKKLKWQEQNEQEQNEQESNQITLIDSLTTESNIIVFDFTRVCINYIYF